MRQFGTFIAMDWSGQSIARPRGIAIAICTSGQAPPVLVEPPVGGWSRAAVVSLLREDLPDDALVGVDLGISLPFTDRGAFFPGWKESPGDARALWALIEDICAHDPHLSATSLVDHPEASRHFRRQGGREGDLFGGGRGRLRVTEREQERLGCKPSSTFNLVGAAQVGKSSLTGMRVLHALEGAVPVWPIDPLPESGPAIVEIYTTLAAVAAGRTASASKIRDWETLDAALIALDSQPLRKTGAIDDHSADALITAAWMRHAAPQAELWQPTAMTDRIARTEGWTFGVN